MKFKASLQGVDAAFRELLGKQQALSKEQARKQVAAMEADLVAETPVDTGYARSRWKTAEVGEVFVTTNDAPYIEHLNAGSSKQAPAHFVEQVALKYGTPLGVIAEVRDA